MRRFRTLHVAALALLLLGFDAQAARMPGKSDSASVVAGKSAGAIAWQPWSEDAFARAKREKRLILLDLEAVWCHWCHVMNETTYRDPKVAAVMDRHYIALKVDQARTRVPICPAVTTNMAGRRRSCSLPTAPRS